MRRIAIVTLALLAVMIVASQLALPPYLEHRVATRLTTGGGSAQVELSAFPALRLLFREGSSLRVRARGITTAIGPPSDTRVLRDLDGFGEVDIEVIGSRVGPLKVQTFTLVRRHDRPYRAVLDASLSASDVGAFGGGQLGGPLGSLLGGIAGGTLPFGNTPIPLSLSATLASDGGTPRAEQVQGAVAGLPAATLIEALALAFGSRI